MVGNLKFGTSVSVDPIYNPIISYKFAKENETKQNKTNWNKMEQNAPTMQEKYNKMQQKKNMNETIWNMSSLKYKCLRKEMMFIYELGR